MSLEIYAGGGGGEFSINRILLHSLKQDTVEKKSNRDPPAPTKAKKKTVRKMDKNTHSSLCLLKIKLSGRLLNKSPKATRNELKQVT